MSTFNSSPPEILIARKTPWHKRLWIRIFLILLVTGVMLYGVWWWPRRGMVAVWWAGGTVTSQADTMPAVAVLNWLYPSGWTSPAHDRVHYFLSSFRTDEEISAVELQGTHVDDRWLAHIAHFPNLQGLVLHDRQLGPGLENLRGNQQLTHLCVENVSHQHLMELRRLPQLESLMLVKPQSDRVELEALASLPNLKDLYVRDCLQAAELLMRLPELPQLESMNFYTCRLSDEDLIHLQRLPNLKRLDIAKSGPVNDEGLRHLSRLTSLETLCIRMSSGQITDAGLQALKPLEKLQEMIVIRGDFTSPQLQTVKQTLPKATILVR